MLEIKIFLLSLFVTGSNGECIRVAYNGEEYDILDRVPTSEECQGNH